MTSACRWALLFSLAACGAPEPRQQASEASPAARPQASSRQQDELDLLRHELDQAVQLDRTLIYRCRWLRAEEVAETLWPLLEHSYGPGVRLVAHPETNQLLISLPPRSSRQATPPAK